VLSREKLWKLRMAYKSFEDLDVWKRSCQLAVKIYELLKDCRDFGLKDQTPFQTKKREDMQWKYP
jgi:hypothetical protein